MTNGEMLKAIFPSAEIDIGNGGNDIWIAIDCWTIFKKEWWDAEYQEPTTKNDKVDCKHTDCNNCVNHKYCDYESTTKNDLGVDAISREQAIEEADKLCLETSYDNEKVEEMLRELPPVTPQPRKGHWIEEFNDLEGEVRFTCSSCGKYQLFGTDFCYHCGARMVESQESEGTE